ncbi:MAG: DUF1566 domain-containing protein [Chromatiaceae bacterium]|nr:DUF1566 domain-containing protein [Chromatiaceae bacterium]
MLAYCDGTDWIAMGRKQVAALNADNMPTGGLVGYWKLDETSGTTAADSSGNGNNGTMQGSLNATNDSVAGKVGTALKFDGVNDYVDTADYSFSKTDSFTFSLWYNPSNAGGDDVLFGKPDSGGWEYNLGSVGGNGLVFYYYNTSAAAGIYISKSNALVNDKWHHLVVTYDGSSAKTTMYINGTQAAVTTGVSGTLINRANKLHIGHGYYTAGSSYYAAGKIDDFRIYNRALDESEIQCLAGVGPCSLNMGLVGHWKLDETSGTVAADNSGNGNNGTMQGSLNATNDSVAGKVGTALKFDGMDDYINIGTSTILDGVSAVSVSAWVKTTDIGAIFTDHYSDSFWETVELGTDHFIVNSSNALGTRQMVSFAESIKDDSWHHVVGVWDGSDIELYDNGVLANTASAPSSPWNSARPFTIGARMSSVAPGTHSELEALIDDVRIYSRALSASEVSQLYCQGVPGKASYNLTDHVMQFCSDQGLHAMGRPVADPAASCSTIGDTCPDGSVYAGNLSGTDLFVPPADQSAGIAWNNGNSSGRTATGQTSVANGATNTANLITIDSDSGTGGMQPHQAAQLCADLNAHGHTDWYLPALDELHVLYANQGAIGGFTQLLYWSSTESSSNLAWRDRFNYVNQNANNKDDVYAVRCTRVGSPGGCSGPTGAEGSLTYSTVFGVMQYCNGTAWVLVGKVGVDPCAGSPAVGTVCGDGTVYAGLTPDGNVKMYVTRCDAGQSWNGSSCTGGRSTLPWNNGNASNKVGTGITNNNTGQANTTSLIAIDSNSGAAGIQPHQAAQYCADLNINGKTDWYLPARGENSVLYANGVAIGNYLVDGSYYWSSSEYDTGKSWGRRYSDGFSNTILKEDNKYVRCARHN